MTAVQFARIDRRPPAPLPRAGGLGPLRLYRALRRNAITAWRADAFEEPYIADRNQLGGFVLLNDPDLIRHVLIDNAANYPKDALQLEKLTPAVGRGLLTAEGGDWRLQRRTVAPLFQPAAVASYLAAMAASVDETAGALGRPCARRRRDRRRARDDRAHLRHHLAHRVQPRDRDLAGGDGRGDHHLFRGARAHRPVGRAAAAALAAAPGLHPRPAGAEDLSRRGRAGCSTGGARASRRARRCRTIW